MIAVLVTGACGTGARAPIDGNSTPVTYKGTLDQTPPVTFGGTPYCMYTITLKQLDVEAIVPPCPNGSLPSTIATYTFASATPSESGTTLAFQGATGNASVVSLVVELSSVGAA